MAVPVLFLYTLTDTVEDLLDTERPILTGGNNIMARLLRTDPRATVRAIKHKVSAGSILIRSNEELIFSAWES